MRAGVRRRENERRENDWKENERKESERKAREEKERKAREESERKEAERKENERKAREDRERKEREESERRDREDAERKAQEERDRKAKDESEKAERERRARDENEKRTREENERRARDESERRAREDSERKENERKESERNENERKEKERKEKEEKKAREEAEKRAKEDKAREEKERKAREEQEKKEKGSKSSYSSNSEPSSSISSGSEDAGTGNKWEQMMAHKAEEEFHADRERIRGRRGGGNKFVDEQLRTLISVIKKLNKGGGGLGSCTFGVLFDDTVDTMPALAATILQAKKRGIVEYDGQMLMQGTNDNVVIKLISDVVVDSNPYKSVQLNPDQIKKITQQAEASGVPIPCHICNKTVYPNEKIVANSKTMHKACFRCTHCQAVLKLAAYAFGNGKFYCEPHFQYLVQANAGYNF